MKSFYLILIMALICSVFSCSDFLDAKPDQKMAVPSSLEHADLLLNDYSAMNSGYPTLGEISADDYFLRTNNWQSISNMDERQAYIWLDEDIVNTVQWQHPYRTVYRSNQVLDILNKLDGNIDPEQYRRVWGGAHFFRAFAFHQIVTTFAPAYDKRTSNDQLGIPLRLSPDLDYKSSRSSLEETYKQIIADYIVAAHCLPVTETLIGRPSRAAAYGALAAVYLDMADYDHAYLYADSCLSLYNELLDYNEIVSTAALPFARFNKEVLFPAITPSAGPLGQAFALIDTVLYKSYGGNDTRKVAYFRHNVVDPGTYAFKGSYNNTAAGLFVGFTTSEIYLIRAETAIRGGRVDQALADINHLLKHRLDSKVAYAPINDHDPDKLLETILIERRKELVFRGRRWRDLKRLNQDGRFSKTLVRYMDGQEYKLEPNSPRYAIKVPYIVIEETEMPQNTR